MPLVIREQSNKKKEKYCEVRRGHCLPVQPGKGCGAARGGRQCPTPLPTAILLRRSTQSQSPELAAMLSHEHRERATALRQHTARGRFIHISVIIFIRAQLNTIPQALRTSTGSICRLLSPAVSCRQQSLSCSLMESRSEPVAEETQRGWGQTQVLLMQVWDALG